MSDPQNASATLVAKVQSLASRVGVECKALAGAILQAKTDVKNDLLGGAGEAYDTLKELSDLIQANGASITTLQALAAGHVKYDDAQTLTPTQQFQARENIAAADAADVVNLSAQTLTAAQQTQVLTNIGGASATDVQNLQTALAAAVVYTAQTLTDAQQYQARENIGAAAAADLGDVDNADFVSDFETALA